MDEQPPELTPENYINRELSWIDFNCRVLAQAQDESIPLLERIKFLAIVSSNTDEFFMVRVAFVHQKLKLGLPTTRPDGVPYPVLMDEIRERVVDMMHQQRETHARPARSAGAVRRRSSPNVDTLDPAVAAGAARLLLRRSLPGADAAGGRSRASRSRLSPTSA